VSIAAWGSFILAAVAALQALMATRARGSMKSAHRQQLKAAALTSFNRE
jgi:hypothetical protein